MYKWKWRQTVLLAFGIIYQKDIRVILILCDEMFDSEFGSKMEKLFVDLKIRGGHTKLLFVDLSSILFYLKFFNKYL